MYQWNKSRSLIRRHRKVWDPQKSWSNWAYGYLQKMSSKIQLRTLKMTIRSKNFQTRSDVAVLSGEEGNFMSSTKGKK